MNIKELGTYLAHSMVAQLVSAGGAYMAISQTGAGSSNTAVTLVEYLLLMGLIQGLLTYVRVKYPNMLPANPPAQSPPTP